MIGKLIQFRGLLVLVVLIGLALIINRATTVDVSATGGATAVIVELQDDPAAIYKVKAEKRGVHDKARESFKALTRFTFRSTSEILISRVGEI